MTLAEGQWEIVYDGFSGEPAGDLIFGTLDTGYGLMTDPDVNYSEAVVGDIPMPMEDGIRFGLDFTQSNTLTFSINVDSVDAADRHATNSDRMSRLARVWNARALRLQPGAVATLNYCRAGRQRLVFGRPRRFAPASLSLTRYGHTPVIMDFTTADDRFYGTKESVRITRAGTVTGTALHHKLSGRLSSGSGRTRQAAVTIGGDRPTTPIITVHGPCTNPRVSVANSFTVALNLTLTDGAHVTIDPRPWQRTVLRANGSNVAGSLTRDSTRLSRIQLDNGTHTVTFETDAGAGSAYVDIEWWDAYSFL